MREEHPAAVSAGKKRKRVVQSDEDDDKPGDDNVLEAFSEEEDNGSVGGEEEEIEHVQCKHDEARASCILSPKVLICFIDLWRLQADIQEEFYVKRIYSVRNLKDMPLQFLVEWQDCPDKDTFTWEPVRNLPHDLGKIWVFRDKWIEQGNKWLSMWRVPRRPTSVNAPIDEEPSEPAEEEEPAEEHDV
ncbi:MAG: hypothetical protein SGPRY_010814 [Prymnesium sp.]